MPVKIFINDNGIFTDKSASYGLTNTEGWWHTIIAKDLNGDGRIDFVLGNQGLNSFFKASATKPVTMYVNDFDLNGSVEQIICAYNGDKSYPVAMKDDLVKQIPSLSEKFKKFDDYKEATIENIFTSDVLERSIKLKACTMESCILMNTGREPFRLIPLPVETQFSPVYSIIADDFDHDGICDILIGGNQYRAKPVKSGIFTKGEIRDLKKININENRYIVVARNNDNLQFYKY